MKAFSDMAPNNFENHIKKLLDDRFLVLLILIISMLVLTPFLNDFVSTKILMDVFLTAIFIFIIYTLRLKRSQAIIASVLVLPLIITTWSTYFIEHTSIHLLTKIFGALFFAYAAINISRIISKSEKVSKETIFAHADNERACSPGNDNLTRDMPVNNSQTECALNLGHGVSNGLVETAVEV